MVIFWDAESGDILKILKRIYPERLLLYNTAISPDAKKIAFGLSDDTVRIWNVDDEQIIVLRGHADYVKPMSFSPDGKNIIIGDRDGKIIFWDVESKESIKTFISPVEDVHKYTHAVALSLDGKTVISGDGYYRLRFWDIESGTLRSISRGFGDWSPLSVSPVRNIVSFISNTGDMILFDIQNGEREKIFKGQVGSVTSISFSPDGKIIATGTRDGMIVLWDVESAEQIRAFNGHNTTVYSIVFSHDGKNLLSGAGYDNTGEVKLWDAATCRLIRTFGDNE